MHVVIPLEAGIQEPTCRMDSRFHGNDKLHWVASSKPKALGMVGKDDPQAAIEAATQG